MRVPSPTMRAPIPVEISAFLNVLVATVAVVVAAAVDFTDAPNNFCCNSAALVAIPSSLNPLDASLIAVNPLVNFIAPSTLLNTFSASSLSIPIVCNAPSISWKESRADRVVLICLSNEAVVPSIFIVTPSNAEP